jgi:hypothetical protein
MGWLKDARSSVAAKHAARALEEGRTVLLFNMNIPRTKVEGTPVSGVAEQIEAIESVGWRLDKMSFSDSGYFLFRRA